MLNRNRAYSIKLWSFKYLPLWLRLTVLSLEGLFIGILLLTAGILWDKSQFISTELRGIRMAEPSLTDLVWMGRYRGACTALLLDATSPLRDTCEKAQKHLVDAGYVDVPNIPQLVDRQEALPAPKAFFMERTAVNLEQRDALRELYASSKVMLDPNPDTYALGEMYFFSLPNIIEGIGRLRGVIALTPYHPDMALLRDKTLGAIEEYLTLQQATMDLLRNALIGRDAGLFRLAATKDSRLFDYLQRADEIVGGQANSGNIPAEAIATLFAEGTAIIDDYAAINQEVGSVLTRHLQQDYDDNLSTMQMLFLLAVILQIIIIVVVHRISVAYLAVQSSRDASLAISKELSATLEKQERMFSVIGHELRTPAAAMKMMVQEMAESKRSGITIKDLNEVSQHLLNVLDDMRVSGDSALLARDKSKEPMVVSELIQTTLESLSRFAEDRNFMLDLHSDADSTKPVFGSKQFIRQVVTNLVKNAIIHSGGTAVHIELTAKVIGSASICYRVAISDDGKGIPEKSREKLFEAFERGDTEAEGSGLGLHVCRQLAQSLDSGSLQYEESPSGGSCFVLEFELILAQKNEDVSEHSSQKSPLAGQNVLFAEDTDMLRMLGTKMVEKAGSTVQAAVNGREALERFDNSAIDLVITDIFMPEMDGYRLASRLRERGFKGPIIGLTGATVGDEAKRLLAHGADAVLAKPLSIDALEKALLEVTSG